MKIDNEALATLFFDKPTSKDNVIKCNNCNILRI